MDLNNPAESTINIVMQYNTPFNTKEVTHGRTSEPKACESYFQKEKKNHENFTVNTTGLHINNKFPYLGASPDGIVYCLCHGKGLRMKDMSLVNCVMEQLSFSVDLDDDVQCRKSYHLVASICHSTTNICLYSSISPCPLPIT